MNNEVIKAMNRKPKEESKIKQFRKWWGKNGYKVLRVVLLPLWFAQLATDAINKYFNAQNEWSEVRANQILNYYIPRRAEYDAESKSFYFFDNGYGWSLSLAKRYLKRKDRRFWKCNCSWWGGQMRQHLIKTFELDGFKKEVLNTSDGWTEIEFKLIEK